METVAQTFILTILTVFGLTSCDNKVRTQTDQSTKNAETTFKATTNQEITLDTIQNDQVYKNYKATLLTTGILSDIGNKTGTEKWFGLFHCSTGYYLAQTKIIIERATHPLLDDSKDKKSGFSVQTLNKDESIILIAGLDFLKNHKISNLEILQPKDDFSSIPKIFPGDTLKFNYLGIDYNIYATGGKKVKDKYQYVVWDYKLYLSSNKNGQVITELMTQKLNKAGPDEITSIIFAGDIDNDGFLDLLIDNAEYKGLIGLTLHLSKPADNGHLLKVVGQYMRDGC